MAEQVGHEADKSAAQSKQVEEIDTVLSGQIEQLIQELNKGTHPMSNEAFIAVLDKAVVSHEKWVNKLENMLNEAEIVPIQINGARCEFGHFYSALQVKHSLIKEKWESIDKVHKALHQNAHYVIEALEKKEMSKARQIMDETKNMSIQIIAILQEIKREVQAMTLRKEQIFEGELRH